MAMTATEIITNLNIYQDLLNEIYQHEIGYAKKTEGFIRLEKKVKSAYSFITLELRLANKEQQDLLHCEISFELRNAVATLKEVYLADKNRTAELEKIINTHLSGHDYKWQQSPKTSENYQSEVLAYLAIANTIAETAYNCAHGDNYSPGYFSKIKITDELIELSQVNHMNSRSLDHKTDYSLRDLIFTIPLQPMKLKTSFDDTKIGDMIIHFSDRSSVNNKPCGDRIAERIESEKAKYIQSNSKS